MNVKLTAAEKIRVLNSFDMFGIMRDILLREKKIDRNKEHFWVVCLDSRNRILMIELISLGTVNATLVTPMEVFSFTLQKRAVQIIMVHNHPSGDTAPSQNDIALTNKMFAVGKFVHCPVIEHLIISEHAYYSFEDSGLLEKLRSKDTPLDILMKGIDVEGLVKMQEDVEKKLAQAELSTKITMAKKMLAKKKPIAEIVEFTGLKKKQVEGLR